MWERSPMLSQTFKTDITNVLLFQGMKLVGDAFEKHNSFCEPNEKIPLIGIVNWGSLERKAKEALQTNFVTFNYSLRIRNDRLGLIYQALFNWIWKGRSLWAQNGKVQRIDFLGFQSFGLFACGRWLSEFRWRNRLSGWSWKSDCQEREPKPVLPEEKRVSWHFLAPNSCDQGYLLGCCYERSDILGKSSNQHRLTFQSSFWYLVVAKTQ